MRPTRAPRARRTSCAPRARLVNRQHTREVFEQWQSSAAGRRAGVIARRWARRRAPQVLPVLPRQGRVRRLQGHHRRCASSSPTAARSARAASRAPAAGTRTRSPRPSSARASSRCCPYVGDTREDRDERGRPRARRPRPRPRPLGRAMPQAILLQDHETARRARHGRRRLEGLPAQLPDPAQAGRARDQGRDRRRRAPPARPPTRALAERDQTRARERRAAQPTVLTITAPGGRRRPPVRLRHVAGHRRRDQGGPRHRASTAARSTSRSRSARSARAWSTSRSPTASPRPSRPWSSSRSSRALREQRRPRARVSLHAARFCDNSAA